MRVAALWVPPVAVDLSRGSRMLQDEARLVIISDVAAAPPCPAAHTCSSAALVAASAPLSACVQVKAQIKLRFCGANKKPAVVTRNFSLVQKPAKKEYKAFEAALRTVGANGETSVMSFKTADLNKLVPEMMGVSTAVLESVVFVHQEDSCWPLAEDKVLKQKFDDIFAATEYTKALDQLKTFKNDKAKVSARAAAAAAAAAAATAAALCVPGAPCRNPPLATRLTLAPFPA